jgi:hypothetical protein
MCHGSLVLPAFLDSNNSVGTCVCTNRHSEAYRERHSYLTRAGIPHVPTNQERNMQIPEHKALRFPYLLPDIRPLPRRKRSWLWRKQPWPITEAGCREIWTCIPQVLPLARGVVWFTELWRGSLASRPKPCKPHRLFVRTKSSFLMHLPEETGLELQVLAPPPPHLSTSG